MMGGATSLFSSMYKEETRRHFVSAAEKPPPESELRRVASPPARQSNTKPALKHRAEPPVIVRKEKEPCRMSAIQNLQTFGKIFLKNLFDDKQD